MTFDVRRVDQNLQTIAAIESAWDLPELPDEVKLDLAVLATPPVLAEVLTGVNDDLDEAERREPLPTRFDLGFPEPVNPTAYAYNGRETIGRTVAGILNLDPPQAVSRDAALRLKQRLASEGYLNLTPEEVVSPRWLPEYSYAAARMSFDDMTRRFQGNQPGSFSIDQVFDWVDQWLSPRGLYRAAVELDLFWDTEAIRADWGNPFDPESNWGQKWAAWSEDKLNVRKLIDAVTGPIDDLLFPIINWGLMFSGIGEVMGVGRALHLGFKGADAVNDLYRTSKLIMAGADDVARLAGPSWLSGKVARMGKAGQFVSERIMDAWRAKRSVILAKKVNQQVLRAGFVSNVQQWVDSDRGGASISHWTGGQASETVYRTLSNPVMDWAVDMLIYPTNIFKPGMVTGALQAVGRTINKVFYRASSNQHLLHGFDQAVLQHLEELKNAGDEVAAAQLDRYRDLRGGSVRNAIKEVFFDGDDEQMGAAFAYMSISAALDYRARQMADVVTMDPLHTFDSGTQRNWHHFRNMFVPQLRVMDPNNLQSIFRHIAKYGDGATSQAFMGRKAKDYYRRFRQVEEAFLEPDEVRRARGAAVPEGHTRFVGVYDDNDEILIWRRMRDGETFDDDPFFVDIRNDDLLEALGGEGQRIIDGSVQLPETWANRYLVHDEAGNLRYRRLSEAGTFRMLSEEGAQRLRDIARRHNELRSQVFDNLLAEVTPEVVASYMYQVMPTLGNWGKFVEAVDMVNTAANRGDLLNVTLTTPISMSGRRLSAMPMASADPLTSWEQQVGELLLELSENRGLFERLQRSVFAPLARHVDPAQGAFTVALKDTVDKAEALTFAAGAERLVRLANSVRDLRRNGLYDMVADIARTTDDAVTSTTVREILAAQLGEAGLVTDRSAEKAARLIREARRRGLDFDDLEAALLDDLEALDHDPMWSSRFGVATGLPPKRGDSVHARVMTKVRELRRLSEFMATTVEGAPKALVDALDARGYKLVYGVEFAQPPDLDNLIPAFGDIKRRHIAVKTLGDFFSRQDGPMVASLKSRKLKDALVARLRKVENAGKPLNLPNHPGEPSADLRVVMDDLRDILHEHWEQVDNALDTAGDRMWEKFATRAAQAHVAGDINSLASAMGTKLIRALEGRGYSREQATAIYDALQASRALGFRTHGLYAIESTLRGKPIIAQGLRLFGTTQDLKGLKKVGKKAASAGIGSFAGLVTANAVLGDEEAVQSDRGILTRIAAMGVGGALGARGLKSAARLAERIERGDVSPRLIAWNYLGDQLANIRDTARFALSPIFDASRYSEAIVLNQVAELPEGIRNLRINQSPTAWRKARARSYVAKGASRDEARLLAQRDWADLEREFAAAARGQYDFDLESHHETMRRFRSVGVLGFSPTDWMTSTFGHLREAGVDAKAAYETVRNIYTYGMTGRSAAELSMNFVFFPFSFTKKTVGHFAKFFQQDLGRLIVLHDAVATYQLLDEYYDLGQVWQDRLPILQKAHRLNLLAYGIGLGQFGGVNAPILGALGQLPGIDEVVERFPGRDAIVNVFLPQMVRMESMDDTETVWEVFRDMLPVVNDVNTLIGSLVEQGYVVGSDSHMTKEAEQRLGWEEWRTFQEDFERQLAQAGLTWQQAARNPVLGILIDRKRAEIGMKYPAWVQGLGDGIAHSNAIRMELDQRLQFPVEPADEYLIRFNELVRTVEAISGVTFDGAPERIGPHFFDLLRRQAIEYVKEEPTFLRLYNRFYRRLLGDITTEI
ncbi:MAG TPA: hypothetical protein VF377_08925 [Acidimicrobiia bacterium]